MSNPQLNPPKIVRPLQFDNFADVWGCVPGDYTFHIICGKTVDAIKGDKELYGRLTTTPTGAKMLMQLLQMQVEKYESQFGEIKVPDMVFMDDKGKMHMRAPKEAKKK